VSARRFVLGLGYGWALGIFTRTILDELDRRTHNAKPKKRP
jgi:hypothetical protein